MTEKHEMLDVEPDAEVKEEFREASQVNKGSQEQLFEKLEDYRGDKSPILSGGDIDAAWEDSDVGEESVGGGNPTPDQDVVEEIGEAYGVTFEDNEPPDLIEKMEKRDRDRWELDPSSADNNGGEML